MPDTTNLTPTPAVSTVFPQEIELTLTLKYIANDQDERDYWLEPSTTNVTLDAVADIFDILGDSNVAPKSINGYTYAQLQQAMSEREV
jgi:hypothetical protein